MELQEFESLKDSMVEQAVQMGYDLTGGETYLTRSLADLGELDRVVGIMQDLWTREQITEEVAWNASVSFGILLGEMLTGCSGCRWAIDGEGTPVVESSRGRSLSPLIRIYETIRGEENSLLPGRLAEEFLGTPAEA